MLVLKTPPSSGALGLRTFRRLQRCRHITCQFDMQIRGHVRSQALLRLVRTTQPLCLAQVVQQPGSGSAVRSLLYSAPGLSIS